MESKSSLVDTGTAIYVLILSSDCPGSIPGASTEIAAAFPGSHDFPFFMLLV